MSRLVDTMAGTSRRKRWWGIGVLILVGITMFCIRLWPSDRSLLARATRIMPLGEGASYYWLSNHAILVLDDGFYIYDTRTGVRKDCPILDKLFRSTLPEYNICVSPDGQRLLWVSLSAIDSLSAEDDFRYWVYCATLDGRLVSKARIGTTYTRHGGRPHSIGWMGDGQRWWEWIPDPSQLNTDKWITGSERLRVRTIGSSQNAVVLAFPAGHQDDAINAFRFTNEGLVTYDLSEGDNAHSIADEYRIGSKIEWIRRDALPPVSEPVPEEADDNYIAAELSVRGDRVCRVQNQIAPVSSLANALHRFVPSIPIEPRKVTVVSACELRSKHFTEVGIIDRAAPDYEMPLDQLAWTPDGHHLSFVYKNALYTVSAD